MVEATQHVNAVWRFVVWTRVALAMTLMLMGWAAMLVWLFGGEGMEGIGLGGPVVPNWQVLLDAALHLWPVVAPFCLGVLFQAVGGAITVLFGWKWLAWTLRGISVPLGTLAAWALIIGAGTSFDKLEGLPPLFFAIAVWVAPIRRRKSSPSAESPQHNRGSASA